MKTKETTTTEASTTNIVAMTENEKQFVEKLCSNYKGINEELREYKKVRELFSQKYDGRKITLGWHEKLISNVKDNINGLFAATEKEIAENKQKLIEFYNKKQTICKNAFAIYKLYDAKKIDKRTFEYLLDALNTKYENINYVLNRHKDSFKPLYAKKLMKDYDITKQDFIFWSRRLFKYECLANEELFFCMYMERNLSDYLTRVEKHKNHIVNLLAEYTNKQYVEVVF